MSNITLTDVERELSKYPDLWDIYVQVGNRLIIWYDDTLSTEFQVLAEVKETFWKMMESQIKVNEMLQEMNKKNE